MKNIIILALLPVILAAQPIKITGKITNGETNAPIVNAQIFSVSSQKSTFSDRNGDYELTILKSELTTLKFFASGFSPLTMTFDPGNSNPYKLDISLDPITIRLGEVTVTSPRYVTSIQESPFPLSIIEKSDIEGASKLSLAEYISEEPGISLSRDGIWQTDISLRGFRGTGLVLMVDGNRLETATELSARMSMIDQFDVQRVEIIKGAASSMYGTGALGGVINIITENFGFRENPYFNGSLSGYFNSVNIGSGTSLALNAGGNSWFAKVRGSFRGASATETPEGLLLNSHFHDNSISAAVGVKPLKDHELEINFQKYGGVDIGLPGGSAFAAAAVARYPEVNREMYSAEYRINGISTTPANLSLKYYHQLIVRDVEVKMPAATLYPYADHFNDGVTLTTNWLFSGHYRLVLGVDAWQRKMDSRRRRIPAATPNTVVHERPVPLSTFRSGGLFFQNEINNLANALDIAIGGRFDLINVKSDPSYNPDFIVVNGVVNPHPPGQTLLWEGKDENSNSWSVNVAAVYRLSDANRVSFNFGKSFRAPSLEERFQFLDLGALVKLGNPALEPEDGWFYDIGYRHYSNSAMFRVNFYLNVLRNMVVETPGFTFQGRPATQMVNFGAAKLFGFDLAFELQITKGLIFYGSAAMVRGEDSKKQENLPLMPADNGTLGVRVSPIGMCSIDLEITGVNDQNKIAPAEVRTGGYSLVNFAIHLKPIDLHYGTIALSAGADNIFDRLYFNNLATNRGMVKAEPGRNIYLKAEVKF